MPENEFEKQVQQKMDELHFVPSVTVWPEVKKQIAERKKRRLLFIWLPFLLLVLGGSVVIYYPNSEKQINKKDATHENKSALATRKVKEKEVEPADDPATGENEKKSLPAVKKVKQKEVGPGSSQSKNNTGKINDVVISATEKNNIRENLSVIATENMVDDKAQTVAAIKSASRKEAVLKAGRLMPRANIIAGNNYTKNKKDSNKKYNDERGYPSSGTKKVKTDHKNNNQKMQTQKAVVADEDITVANSDELKKRNDKTEANIAQDSKIVSDGPEKDSTFANDAVATVKNKNKDSLVNLNKQDSTKPVAKNNTGAKKKKIEWGMNANAGISNISQGFSRLLSNSPVFDLNYLSAPATSNNGSFGGGLSSQGASDVKPGFAFTAGIFASMPLGKNFSLLVDINYSYLSTSLTTGGKIDTVAPGSQYRTGTTMTYTNRFHFIELPVTIEKQLGSLSRFSVNAGASFSLLAGSNALQYDGQKNIYYVDNSYINKAQWTLLAGFNYRLLQKKFKVEIGPQLNYGINKFFKKELYGSRHLFSAGIGAKIFFGKK